MRRECGQAEQALHEIQKRQQYLLSASPAIIFSLKPSGGPPGDYELTFISENVSTYLGYEAQEFFENSQFWREHVHPEDFQRIVAEFPCLSEQGYHTLEYRLLHKDGNYRWIYEKLRLVQDKASSSSEIIGSWLDITERKQIESALQESEQRYRLMFESSPHPMWVYDLRTLCFLAVNKTAVHCYGYSQEEFLAMSVRDILLYENISLLEESSFITESFSGSGRWRHQKKDGTPIDVEITSGPLTFSGRPARVVLINDITEHKRIERQLLHNAFHDALTALPNRVLFMNYLRKALERTKQCEDYQFAVFFLDLDRFKVINDSLGHLVGDELLLAVAYRLQQCLRPGDMVARLGGDEFTILLEYVKDLSCVNNVAERIHKQFSLPFLLGQREVHTSVSIGMVISVSGYEHPDDILRDADIAMYRAKSLGKGRSVIFSSQIDGYAVEQLSLEIELRQALQRGELRLHYQPIMDIATGRIAQIEALVRWEHPERGLLPPSEFISLAEDSELILPIGNWVLKEACHQMQEWQKLCHVGPALVVCVNLSMRQFQLPDLVEQVAHLLHETGLTPACLVLEITETTTMKDADATMRTLHQLKELGVKLAIDDFGTGYSSLNHLWRFPVDTLKIDRSFVNNLGREPGVEKIVHAVTAIAHALGMSVVAEGIETAEQLTNVRIAGADYGQGYYFLKPCHSNEMTKLIRLGALLQHEATELAGRSVDEVRQIREEIQYHVEHLLLKLSEFQRYIAPSTDFDCT
ncbi:MAG: EAL domain-containing protein [Chroococcidiopsidaceae cyanobacterium CP_BM_ER_R8_30]|nr:EAL domain-containing protein [Chroococcidiopsidaceae cyanobacterium CP_BM_ER_R8_30]